MITIILKSRIFVAIFLTLINNYENQEFTTNEKSLVWRY